MAIPIFMTSWHRKDMTERAVREIHERTTPGTFELHLYDNGSGKETRDYLISLLDEGKITSSNSTPAILGVCTTRVFFT